MSPFLSRALSLTLCLVALLTQIARAAENQDVLLTIEEPRAQGIHSGIGLIRGWALVPPPRSIERIEVTIDGVFLSLPEAIVPYGGTRRDVDAVYGADYPEALNSGYAMAFNYANLTPGEHRIRVRAVDSAGDYLDKVLDFRSIRFSDETFVPGGRMSLPGFALQDLRIEDAAAAAASGVTTLPLNVLGDSSYTLQLGWVDAAQQFALVGIEYDGREIGPPRIAPPSGLSARVAGEDAAVSWNPSPDYVLGYYLERRLGAASFARIATLARMRTSYTDTDVTWRGGLYPATYTYRIQGFTEADVSDYSNTASVFAPVTR